MKKLTGFTSILGLLLVLFPSACNPVEEKTTVSIDGEQFLINGTLTYRGRTWEGNRIEGLLMNARMVQGIFDDLNPETREGFKYPDTAIWDPERNTDEFVAAMGEWKAKGLLAFTLNLQGGSPMGYGNHGWINSAFDPSGEIRPDYLSRLEKILDRADELGMVVILGYFYFGQDEYLEDEAAVIRATENITRWILEEGYGNVLVEINNECNVRYDHSILKPDSVHLLIDRVKSMEHEGRRLLVSTSYGGGFIPLENVVRSGDFILIHGNDVNDPAGITRMVRSIRAMESYSPKPILFNEDDHFAFEKDTNNMVNAIREYASWGYFDFRMKGEGFENGFQSVPVDWGINSERKKSFFNALEAITLDE